MYGKGKDADKVVKVRVSDSVVYMTADEEEGMKLPKQTLRLMQRGTSQLNT